jgi:uncharacterized membrane protein YgcG
LNLRPTLTSAVLLACAIAVSTGALFAQDRADPRHPSVTPTRATVPPRVDGQLDDPIWQTAARITQFVQERPVEGAPATEETDVYLAYDSRQLYFGIHAHYADRSIMRANRSDRDQLRRDDTVTVFFDPFLDQQRGYAFSVNGYGVQGDSLISGSSGGPGGGGGAGGGGGGGCWWGRQGRRRRSRRWPSRTG